MLCPLMYNVGGSLGSMNSLSAVSSYDKSGPFIARQAMHAVSIKKGIC